MPFDPSRLLSQLNNTQLQQKDNPLYQVLFQLINLTAKLSQVVNNSSSGGGGSSSVITNNIIQQLWAQDGNDGQDGIGIQGRDGINGTNGTNGTNGLNGVMGPPGMDGSDGSDGISIVGPIGPIGLQGLTIPGMDGIDGQDGTLSIAGDTAFQNSTNTFKAPNSFENFPIDLISGQLKFPATQNPSSNVNTLDDYEEGDWTPVLSFGGSVVGITYSLQLGSYVKIGRFVMLNGIVVLTNKGAAVGNALFTGLPFTIGNSNKFISSIKINFNAFTAGVIEVGLQGVINTASFITTKNAAGVNTTMANTDYTNTSILVMYFCYMVD